MPRLADALTVGRLRRERCGLIDPTTAREPWAGRVIWSEVAISTTTGCVEVYFWSRRLGVTTARDPGESE